MTITGADASYRSGGPQVPLEEERQASATVAVPKEHLGLVNDSLLNTVINTSEDNRSGHFKSDASRPTLPHLQHARMGGLPRGAPDEGWRAQYDELVDQMPAGVQQQLAKPPEQRGSRYGALNNVTQLSAQTMVKTAAAGAPVAAGSRAAERTHQRHLGPYRALQGGATNGGEAAEQVGTALQAMGPNHPEHGAWQESATAYQATFTTYSDVAGRAIKGQASADDVARLQGAAGQLQGLTQGSDKGTALLTAHCSALSRVAQAFRAPDNAAPALLLGLSMGSVGIGGGTASDPLPPGTGRLLTGLTQGALGPFAAADPGAQNLLLTAMSGVALATALAAKAVLGGTLGVIHATDATDAKGARSFELSLALQVMVHAGLPQAVFSGITTAVGVPAEHKDLCQQHMLLGSMLWVGAIGGGDDLSKQAALLEGVAPVLTALLGHVAEAWSGRAAATDDSQLAAGAAHLQQAHDAAQAGDLEGSLAILWSATSLLGVSQQEFFQSTAAMGSRSDDLLTAMQGDERSGGAADVALAI